MVIKMNPFIILLIIILIILGLIIFYITLYNRFQNYIIRINTVEKDIDNTLRNKLDLLTLTIKIINNNIKEVKLEEPDFKKAKLSNFDLDRKITNLINDLVQLKDKHSKLNNNDNFNKAWFDLNETDEQLTAYKSYYNDNIIKFNKLIRMFPSNIIGKIARFKEKLFYDGKDMNDEDIKDFKV